MNMATKRDIFSRYKDEYYKASALRKREILDAVGDVTGMHRKAVIRKFGVLRNRDPAKIEKRGRPTYYTKDVDAALHDIWEAGDRPCGELLYSVIPEYVKILKRDGMWRHGDIATSKLLAMGEHTARRKASGFRKKELGDRGFSSTKPSHLKSIIPIFKGPWSDLSPGNGQIDTVAHCGNTLLGDFIYTVTYTDSATYWCIPRAQWNKGQEATRESIGCVKRRLPFPLLMLHPDTGSEFVNWHLKDWCDEEGVRLTRSEPGRKNDNMYVEERNGHVVRRYLGYMRLDDERLVDEVNKLYDKLSLHLNHFQTVRRTVSTTRVGSQIKRTYEKKPKTPYERVLESPNVSDEDKEKLKLEHDELNPLSLKKEIDILIAKIVKLRKNDRGKRE